MFTTKKIALVSVINDLVTDNRVQKTCRALIECDYEVKLIGRKLPESLPLPSWPFSAERMVLLFKKGPLFYLFFNVRLFFKLLFSKSELLYANDLDTLLPNYLVSRIKNIPLIYDSHELFCDVPELLNSPFKRRIWQRLESWIVPKLKHCITVNDSIASIFKERYGVSFVSVRNISEKPENLIPKTRPELGLPSDKKIILLQGAGINIDRGAEELIESMTDVKNALLLIIGSGDVWEGLKQKIVSLGLEDKVWMIYKLPKSELVQYTALADLGLSIDKNTNLNYYYSLPNKIFDYLQAGTPILASRLPEIEKIISAYNVGDFIPDHNPANIAKKINEMLLPEVLNEYRKNTKKASEELTWKNEKDKLLRVISEASLEKTARGKNN
ncbi:MAG: glycosyltransferase [Bacteroidia bacterium]|nr:glycosyltransferase [Bacteroidia bacterium]